MGEVGSMGPALQIRRGKDSDHELLRVGDHHHPTVLVANDLWVSELCRRWIKSQDWISGEVGKSVTSIQGVCNFLGLRGDRIQGIDCYNTVCLVWEEAGCVIGIDDDAT